MTLQTAAQHLRAGNVQQAENTLRRVIASEPQNAQALYMLGDLYTRFQRTDLALPLMRKAVKFSGKNLPAYFSLVRLLAEMGENGEMAGVKARLARHAKGDYLNLVRLGLLNQELGYYAEAESAIRKAIALEPERVEAWENLAVLQRDMGDLEEAVASSRKVLQMCPGRLSAYTNLKYLKKYTADDPDLAAMEALYATLDEKPDEKLLLAYTLGRAYDDCGMHERAFEYFIAANQMERRLKPYSRESQRQLFAAVKAQFPPGFSRPPHRAGPVKRNPVFVLGLPRSGTSLAEQILASHSAVFGAGESPALIAVSTHAAAMTGKAFPAAAAELTRQQLDTLAGRYLSQLTRHAGGADYIVDKMPHNFVFIGMIKLLFPEAPIIHCRRNAMDTCVSIYKNDFGGHHLYANDLADLGDYYTLYQDLMAHWHTVFPGQIYDLRYEELVAQPEAGIRALLDYCGLPFEEQCLSFHRTRRSVATASAAQVRKPISTAAIAQWERYRSQLQPLLEALPDSVVE